MKRTTPAEEVRLLQEITRIIGSMADFKEMLHEIIALVSRLTRADACFMYVHDPARKELVLSSSKTPHPNIMGKIRLKLGEGIAGLAAKENTTLIIHGQNVTGIVKDTNRIKSLLKRPNIKNSFIMPLLVKDKVFGVLNLHTKKNESKIDDNLDNLQYLSKLLSSAF